MVKTLRKLKNKLDLNKIILTIVVITLFGVIFMLFETRQAIDALKTTPSLEPTQAPKQQNYLEVMLSNEEAKNFVEEHPDYKADVETFEGVELEKAKEKYPVLYAGVESSKIYKILLSSPSTNNVLLVIQGNETVLKTFPVTKISIGDDRG